MNEQVHLIGGKSYKESDIVMLATDEAKVGMIGFDGKDYHIFCEPSATLHNEYGFDFTAQHLYFLSNDEIKEGDWYYSGGKTATYSIHQADSLRLAELANESSQCSKIIASTNSALIKSCNCTIVCTKRCEQQLPRPSNDFLKKYCELGGIDKVLVEVVTVSNCTVHGEDCDPICWGYNTINRLNVAPDNTITIKSLVVKDSWTADEVIDFAAKMISQYKFGNTNIENKSLLRENLMSAL